MLTRLSSETGQFVPILPYYLDVLNNYNFNRKTSKISMKPVDFESILRISKSQIAENGTKDSTMDKVRFIIYFGYSKFKLFFILNFSWNCKEQLCNLSFKYNWTF